MSDDLPTQFQRRLAEFLDVDISQDSLSVAAARISDAVGPAIAPKFTPRPASERQLAFAKSMGLAVEGDSTAVCSAKIDDELRRRNGDALQVLQLRPGDSVRRVAVSRDGDRELRSERVFIVSSIGKDGRIYFKGGNGEGAWPTQLHRLDDSSRDD